MQTILVVDDECIVTEVVERYLLREKCEVKIAEDGAQALEIAAEWKPDLVVLDLMLPEIDGLEVCRRLRRDGPVPIIMLTAKGEETDRIIGLELGADDYMVKPFSPRELVARVKSVLRRTSDTSRQTDGILRYGDLHINPACRGCEWNRASATRRRVVGGRIIGCIRHHVTHGTRGVDHEHQVRWCRGGGLQRLI